MDRKKPGRGWPEEAGEPRRIEPQPAARDQTEDSPQSVFFDDNSPESTEQIAGVGSVAKSDAKDRVDETGENPVLDTGWLEYRGWKVRTVFLGGGPDPHRRSWLVGKLIPR